ncbi:MAG: hypothetical protein K2H43_03400 [Clostridia bacterium]|nr:hypothetical protein [Clostridia bacterium]
MRNSKIGLGAALIGCILAGAVGCGTTAGNSPEDPSSDSVRPYFEAFDYGSRMRVAVFEEGRAGEDPYIGDCYLRFLNYYNGTLAPFYKKQTDAYVILAPGDRRTHIPISAPSSTISVYLENKGNEETPLIIEQYLLRGRNYRDIPGLNYQEDPSGEIIVPSSTVSTIELTYYTLPVAKELLHDEFTLEYGKTDSGMGFYYKNFVNIYSGELCVGTCYYYEKAYIDHEVPIDRTWLEEYIKSNLITM